MLTHAVPLGRKCSLGLPSLLRFLLRWADISYEDLKEQEVRLTAMLAQTPTSTSHKPLQAILEGFPLCDRYPKPHNPYHEVGDADAVRRFQSSKRQVLVDTRLRDAMLFFRDFVGPVFVLLEEAIIRTVYPVSPIEIETGRCEGFGVNIPNRNLTILGESIYNMALALQIISTRPRTELALPLNGYHFDNLHHGTVTGSNQLKKKSLLKAFLVYKGFSRHVRVSTPTSTASTATPNAFDRSLAIKAFHHVIGEVSMAHGTEAAMAFVKTRVLQGDGLLKFVVDRQGGW